jgi:hypothetical protein
VIADTVRKTVAAHRERRLRDFLAGRLSPQLAPVGDDGSPSSKDAAQVERKQ